MYDKIHYNKKEIKKNQICVIFLYYTQPRIGEERAGDPYKSLIARVQWRDKMERQCQREDSKEVKFIAQGFYGG